MDKDNIFTFASEKRTPVEPEDLEAPVQEGKTMKIKLSELRRIIRETVLRETASPPPGFKPPTSRREWESLYSDEVKAKHGHRPGSYELDSMSDDELESELYSLFDEEPTKMWESDDDKDSDGDADFADVMMSRMMASGMSATAAKKKTRKHDV
jgi:hypothetical protein